MLDSLVKTIQSLVLSFGPLGVFLGMFLESSIVPIPSEAVLVAAGVVGFKPVDVAIFGGLGSTLGAIVGYYIGKLGGRHLLDKYGKYVFITSSKLKFVDNWFERWGDYAVLTSRLIPLIPYKVFSIASGIARMKLTRFVIFTLIGSVPRCFLLSYFGSLLLTTKNIPLLLSVLGIFILLPLIISRISSRKK